MNFFSYQSFVYIIIFSLTLIVSGCSTPEPTAEEPDEQQSEQEKQPEVPSWYSVKPAFEVDGELFTGYSTALASDSANAAERAVEQARVRVESEVSRRLESVRDDAVSEGGTSSDLNAPQFLLKLRKTETIISKLASESNVEVYDNEEGDGYRGFASAQVDRETLIEEFDKAFSAHRQTWESLRDSEAFEEF